MKQLALQALDSALAPGVTYADVRVIESRDRDLSTKNGKPGQVSSAESAGLGIRVLADGCWGFAATDDLGKAGVEATARLAVDIARSSALATSGSGRNFCARFHSSTACGRRFKP